MWQKTINEHMNLIYKIAIILIIAIVSCKGKVKNQPVTSTKPEIDRLKLTDLNNRPIDLGQYRGKALFINFWATWCKPCIAEMPSIQRAQDILENENIVFLLASNETAEQIQKFKNEHEYSFTYVRTENPEELNIMAMPTTFIFSPESKLVFSEMGIRKWDGTENLEIIRKILRSHD